MVALRAVFHAFSFEITGKSCKRRKQPGFNENAGQIAEGALCGQSGGFAPQSRKGGVLQAPLSYLAVPKEEGGERQKVRRHFIAQKYSNEALRFHKPHKGVIMRARAGL
ncbi:MAG: hypothetical protein DBY17_03515 [Oscillospiraceae bacterium]|nr:MAG: hypothetical protein DBY17_03515 [Oscillospiraceae bacterium]